MNTNEKHLSMFELDLYFASSAPDARIAEHVAGCERCSAYLERLDALQQGLPLPSPRQAVSRSSALRRRPRGFGLTLAAGLMVLGAVTALLLSSLDGDAPPVAIKGSPAVQLLVRRGEETRPWDGVSPVQPGDALGLRVACEEFSHVTVAAASAAAPGGWSQLSAGPCPAAGAALPFTLVVDEAPERERLAVVFGMSAFDVPALGAAIDRQRLDAGAWVTRFELDKQVSR
jgi:hypothetical protein